MADLKKGARITGTQRDKLASDLKKKYERRDIRALAEQTGRSYGFVHRVLSEPGVTLAVAAAPLAPRRRNAGSEPARHGRPPALRPPQRGATVGAASDDRLSEASPRR